MALTPVDAYYPALVGGYNPSLPARSMGTDGQFQFRDALNLLVRDGVLNRRALLAEASGVLQPTYTLLSGSADDTEIPIWIYAMDCRTPAGADDSCVVIVTNRNIWVLPNLGTTWKLCTPTYTTGTFTASDGSPNITAVGSLWVTHNITSNQLFRDNTSGTYYKIASITGETTLTLTTNWSSGARAGANYTIVRTFPGGSVLDSLGTEIFATVFNQDLYVAGTFCGSAQSNIRSPAVIRVANIFSTTPTTTYITAQKLLSAGLDIVSNMDRIAGVRALQDGRIVIAGAQNTAFYSSHLNTAVWTVSPAGQTPIVYMNGRVNALGNIGTTLTFHHNEGVVDGLPTGQANPPLSFRATQATQGVYAPRTLRETGGIEYGLTINGSVIAFDLNSARVVSDPIRHLLKDYFRSELYLMHGCVDRDRNEYTLLYAIPFLLSPNTLGWTYQADWDRWWPMQFGAPIGAISDGLAISVLSPITRALAGVASINNSAEVTNLIYYFRETVPGDAIVYTGGSNGGFYVVGDDLDFGDPLLFKNILRVVVWLKNSGYASENVQASISRDQGANWTAASASVTLATTPKETVKQFSFDPLSPGAGTEWRLKLETTNAADVKVSFLRAKIFGVQTGYRDLTEF